MDAMVVFLSFIEIRPMPAMNHAPAMWTAPVWTIGSARITRT